MPKTQGQKLKLLSLYRLLSEESDELHPLTVQQLIALLAAQGIAAERKSLYSDLELLRSAGADIIQKKGDSFGYYLASRRFELPELALLCDAVAASRFITPKKSAELTDKLAGEASRHEAGLLKRRLVVVNRSKNQNEQIYYSVDRIFGAINADRQISFKYFDYSLEKRRVYRRDGELYTASPLALCWDDDNYYLIAYYPRYGGISHFRVDRMEGIAQLPDPRETELPPGFDASTYADSLFSMFGGETTRVRLEFANHLINVALDRFGMNTFIEKLTDSTFSLYTDISVSPAFFGWLFQFGTEARVLSPDSVRGEAAARAAALAEAYKS